MGTEVSWVRGLLSSDLDELKRIHTLYFKDDFYFPDFMHFITAFVVEDEKGIITAGGIRTIAECVAVTNMSRSPQDRIKALYTLLQASTYTCTRNNYDQIYVWSGDAKYVRRLKKNGFRLSDKQSLILDL